MTTAFADAEADHPGIPLPPPFLFAGPFFAGLALQHWRPLPLLTREPHWEFLLGLAGQAVGGLLIAVTLFFFWRHRTSIIPDKPALALVQDGPLRYSRNPLYLALTLIYLSIAVGCNYFWPLVFLPLALWLINRIAIAREEKYLARRFGADYLDYQRRVRRWL